MGSKWSPSSSCRASWLAAEMGSLKAALYLRTVSDPMTADGEAIPSLFMRTRCACLVESTSLGAAAMCTLRRKDTGAGVRDLRNLGAGSSGVLMGTHNL